MILLELIGLVAGSILAKALATALDRHFTQKAKERR